MAFDQAHADTLNELEAAQARIAGLEEALQGIRARAEAQGDDPYRRLAEYALHPEEEEA